MTQEQRYARILGVLDSLDEDRCQLMMVFLDVLESVDIKSGDCHSALLSEVAARQPWLLDHAAAFEIAGAS